MSARSTAPPVPSATVGRLREEWGRWWASRNPWQRWAAALAAAAFVGLHAAAGGLRGDHLLLAAAFAALYYGGPRTRPALRLLLPLLLMLAAFDAQRYVAADWRGPVHVREPLEFDRRWFGIATADGVLAPARWLQHHTHPLLDVVTSVAYVAFVPLYVAVAVRFHRRWPQRPERAERMMWALLWLNLAGCLTYYLYPAAPPWYVDRFGLGPVRLDAAPSAAGALRFDALFGVDWFRDYYALAPNAFGAIPSLHAAIPLLAAYWAFRFGALRLATTGYFLLVGFAAVYLNHHWVLDLLWGAAYALAAGLGTDLWHAVRRSGRGGG